MQILTLLLNGHPPFGMLLLRNESALHCFCQQKKEMGRMKIEFLGISKYYTKGTAALADFSATLSPGIYGLLGANGAGKTTLINILVGLLPSTAGEILVDGVSIRQAGRSYLKQLGYLPQYPQFYRDFTVMDFLLYICALKGICAKRGRARALELLEAVNLKDAAHTKIGSLSGGMRQRVGIAQALLGDPQLLVLDEPTAGLDPQERIHFRNLIARFSENRIVLLATHIVSDADAIANQVLLLKDGHLIQQASPEALEQKMAGKVWELTLPDRQALAAYDANQISNIQQKQGRFHLRLLSERAPSPAAVAVAANLEDVFLYHFGKNVSAKASVQGGNEGADDLSI